MKKEQQSVIDQKNQEQQSVINPQQQNQQQQQQNQQQQQQQQGTSDESFPQKIQQELKPYVNNKGHYVYEQFNNVIDQKYRLEKPIQQYTFQQTLEYERKKLKNYELDDKSAIVQAGNRLEESSRNYKCGCGKKYLSYPALYTHIKQKHQGTAPDGTINISQTTSKRGRPRRLEYQREDENLNEIEPNICEQIQILMKNQQLPSKGQQNAQMVKDDLSTFLNILEENFEGKCNPLEGMPVYKDCNTLYARFHQFAYYIVKMQDDQMSQEMNQQTNCDKIFSIFLLNVAQFVNLKLYRVICIFFRLFRECINQKLYEMIKEQSPNVNIKLERDSRSDKTPKKFTEIENAQFLPIIGEKFILDFLPEKCPAMDQSFASFLFVDFCKWIFKKRVTKIKAEFLETVTTSGPNNLFA